MLYRLIHGWRLARFRQTKRRVARAYDRYIAQAYRDKQPSDKISEIRETRHWELGNCEDEIAQLETEYLTRRAEKYGLPTPPLFITGNLPSEGWYESKMFGGYLLTMAGRADLRSDIRAEKRERREGWLPYISALTGLLGVVVAILALLIRH
jgi:hypothetical protein